MSMRILVLISGRGSNLAALVEAARAQAWPAQVVGVISNRPQAVGLQWAQSQGLPTQVLDHQHFASREAFDEALRLACLAHRPDLVVLAGFMRVLGDAFLQHFEGRLINIHPSLLPAFTGLRTHQRALQAGVKVAGATAHYVTPAVDHGPVIAQAVVPVLARDTEHSLADRVLQAEHHLLPMAVGWHVRGELQLQGGCVRHRHGAEQTLFFPDAGVTQAAAALD